MRGITRGGPDVGGPNGGGLVVDGAVATAGLGGNACLWACRLGSVNAPETAGCGGCCGGGRSSTIKTSEILLNL